jgi:hypothetical protein
MGWAFSNCTELTSVEIGTGVKKIGMFAFMTTGLTSVVIPDSMLLIEEYAFAYNPKLEAAIFLGNAPEMRMNNAFSNDAALFKVYYTSSNTGFTNPWHGYPTTTETYVPPTASPTAPSTVTPTAPPTAPSTETLTAPSTETPTAPPTVTLTAPPAPTPIVTPINSAHREKIWFTSKEELDEQRVMANSDEETLKEYLRKHNDFTYNGLNNKDDVNGFLSIVVVSLTKGLNTLVGFVDLKGLF